jgi:hypothetical protein
VAEFQCAVSARGRDESMFATASQVRRWLLIEVRGAWGRDAVVDSALARYGSSGWRQRLDAEQIRVIAIRRDLDRSSEDALQVFYVDSGRAADRGKCWRRRVPTLHAAVDAAGTLPFEGDGEPVGWTPHRDPLVLVCTNGRHDPCCATFGRPLARDLRQHPRRDDVWECSHIGGDRFAANLVILPEGLYFGRCDTASAERVIDDYGHGAIYLDNYRGRSVLGFYEQAAEYFVRRELAVTSIDDVTAVRRVGTSRGMFAVDLTTNGKQRTVEVRVARSEGAASTPLTCSGQPGQRVPSYELVSIHEGA